MDLSYFSNWARARRGVNKWLEKFSPVGPAIMVGGTGLLYSRDVWWWWIFALITLVIFVACCLIEDTT